MIDKLARIVVTSVCVYTLLLWQGSKKEKPKKPYIKCAEFTNPSNLPSLCEYKLNNKRELKK